MLGPSTVDRVRLTLESFATISMLAQDTLNGNYSEIHKPSIFSRALIWKLIAMKLNKVNSQEGHKEVELNLGNLSKLRKDYSVLLTEFDVPWYELNPQSEYYETLKLGQVGFDITEDLSKRRQLSRMRVLHDPLNAENEKGIDSSAFTNSYQDTDLRMLEAIITDVDRLFPECPQYFIQSIHNRKMLVQILYLWCKLNGVAYFQGLHEICGLIYLVFFSESVDPVAYETQLLKRRNETPDKLDRQILYLMDSSSLSHDTFTVFNILMKPIMAKYYSESALLQEAIMFDLKLHQTDKFLYYLFKTKFRLDSRIWLMRYFRLVLIREIGLGQSMRLWDELIAFSFLKDPFKADLDITLLLPYVIIIMLSVIRPRLIVSDYGEALYLLLHYPVQTEGNSLNNKLVAMAKDSIILMSDDDDDASNNGLDFTYIEENHQRQRLSESSSSGDHGKDVSSSNSGPDPETQQDNVKLNINRIVRDAAKLSQMSDSELEKSGCHVLETYSGMYNEEDKKGRLSTGVKRSSSPFFEDMLKGASSWNHRKSSSISSSLTGDFDRMTIQPEEMQPTHTTEKKDFTRTRMEMRLQKKVNDAMKK
ncbi:DEKNAAC104749 [Brettanomyces naardenensis]|uniref:DEKNAAC104749 n=1 Tax=Brettanomyces naardenensis TaxID=13370 RepID=A0A448YRJ9_BRENA|nr:DEKNAAC104749 [Brettanomyces naardenensis]